MKSHFHFHPLISLLALAIGLLWLSGMDLRPTRNAAAQSAAETWSLPVNLSNSGGTSQPVLATDSTGEVHVIWSDEFAGFMYTHGDGETWTEPVQVNFPFDTYTPLLIADHIGKIHALWVDERGALFYSVVRATSFGSPSAWEFPIKLADSALNPAAVVDANGTIHLTYIRPTETSETPAGVYYRRLGEGSNTWSSARLLYQSLYLRTLDSEEAHIAIAASSVGGAPRLFVVWDNQPRKVVFEARSPDGGQTWDTPLDVSRAQAAAAEVPFNIQVSARGEEVLLVWQTRQPDLSCVQYYQVSPDAGETWQSAQEISGNLPGCPLESRFFINQEGTTFLWTVLEKQIYLQAWDGKRWSERQEQPALISFNDPETRNPVLFGCRKADLVNGARLFVVGCDNTAGPFRGGDIWVTTRELGTAAEWFPPPSVWDSPVLVGTRPAGQSAPILAADSLSRYHVIWRQRDDTSRLEGADAPSAIYYTQWTGERWLQPAAVLKGLKGKPEKPAMIVDAEDRLLVVWSEGQNGIFFSWAGAARASSQTEWTSPQPLPEPRPGGQGPDILSDAAGTILVAYSIPINEERGVYLTRSTDGGFTWGSPLKVFDGAAAGWEVVGPPQLALTGQGQVHILFSRQTFSGNPSTGELYYARSEDAGNTWSEPELVAGQSTTWSRIAGTGARTVHRLWEERSTPGNLIRHQISLDNGLTWSRPANVSGFGEITGPASLAADDAGQMHLAQLIETTSGKLSLQHWLWNGESWRGEESLEFGAGTLTDYTSLAATTSTDGHLAVLLAILNTQSGSEDTSAAQQEKLFFTRRPLDLPSVPSSPLPTLTPTPEATPGPTKEPTPAPTPTLDIRSLDESPGQTGIPLLENAYGGLLLGGGLAALLVAVLVMVLLAIQKKRR